jgi:sodium/hydrogen exchanger-like protein 6/7
MDGSQLSPTHVHAWATPMPTDKPVAEEEEYYSSWSLFLVCLLLIVSLWTSYYLQIKRIRVIHETLVSIFAGMFVGLIVRLAPGNMIREMLVGEPPLALFGSTYLPIIDVQAHPLLQSAPSTDYPQFRL